MVTGISFLGLDTNEQWTCQMEIEIWYIYLYVDHGWIYLPLHFPSNFPLFNTMTVSIPKKRLIKQTLFTGKLFNYIQPFEKLPKQADNNDHKMKYV